MGNEYVNQAGAVELEKLIIPNFIICGVPKSGTSSLHTWIADHPDAAGSREKETYVFADPGTHMFKQKYALQDIERAYSEFFTADEVREKTILLESTPAYIYSRTALERIPCLPSKPKCLFVLREPSSQIYSLYSYFKNNWGWIDPSMTFSAYIDALRCGADKSDFKGNELAADALKNARYGEFLSLWRDALGDERMMVCDFDQLKENPLAFTKAVAEWLGLNPDFYDGYAFPNDNETYQIKAGWLQRVNLAVRQYLPKGRTYLFLRDFYRAINTRKSAGPSDSDKQIINQLKMEYRESNRRLQEDFGLDLTGWGN